MYDFFLSYSRDTYQNFTKLFVSELTNQGFSVWIDQFDVPLGVNIYDNIIDVLQQCTLWHGAIIVFDNTYFEKDLCIWELEVLLEKKIPIFPVLYNITKKDFPEKYKEIIGSNYGKSINSESNWENHIINVILLFYIQDERALPNLDFKAIKMMNMITNNLIMCNEIFELIMLTSIATEFLINKSSESNSLHWLSIVKKKINRMKNIYFENGNLNLEDQKILKMISTTIIGKYFVFHV